jgi:hypothetical protein
MNDMKNWKEESGIPHDNGKIKWYAIGLGEDESVYVGEYDMTDWDKTFDEQVFPKAEAEADRFFNRDDWHVMRKDQVIDVMHNLSMALHLSGDFKKNWIGADWWDEFDEGDE